MTMDDGRQTTVLVHRPSSVVCRLSYTYGTRTLESPGQVPKWGLAIGRTCDIISLLVQGRGICPRLFLERP
jgi:hypothetical protein